MKRCKVWKLKEDVTADIFRAIVQIRAALVLQKPGDVKSVCLCGRISRKA